MNTEVRRLKQGTTVFFPQTVADAVIVKDGSEVTTLKEVINRKVSIINSKANSGIIVSRTGTSVDISHTNQVTPIEAIQPMQIAFDNNGHITNTLPLGKLVIMANSEKVLEADGTSDQELIFGDDFQKDNNIITLRWNNYGNS